MLLLTRRIGETIVIEKGQIKIKVLYQYKGIVALGITTPIHVDVDHQETFIHKYEDSKTKRVLLACRNGETIVINKGQIEIKVIYQYKGIVALGIKAPAHIEVDRKEIFIRKQAKIKTELNQQ